MTSPISTKNAAPANSPIPVPPFLRLSCSSDLASWISLLISVEMSRVASETSRPIVGSVSLTGSFAIGLQAPRRMMVVGLVVPTLQRGGTAPPCGSRAASLTDECRAGAPARPWTPVSSEGHIHVRRTSHPAGRGAGGDAVPERPPAQRTGRRAAGAGSRRGGADLGELTVGLVVPVLHRVRARSARPRALGC